ncbi:Helitron helicase-like protein [Phytophthora palmivora]|uniref:Helitron helicase-like protein n=1 Tax=Phytophthora palmivora TaxID=4796 RepID=A0A2P4XW34_9STRA|nr:Helitron helicase-like protein [Phytophthora palmivora]
MPYAGELNNVNNDQGERPRVGNDQTDQSVEGDLAEWGYSVQYEDSREERRKTTMSLREFVAYLLYDHTGSHSRLLLGGRLTSTGQERLRYIENNQLEFRIETIQGLSDVYRHEDTEAHRIAAVHDQYARNYTSNRGYRQNTSEEEIVIDTNNIGGRLIFTGGPRYMYQRFQDAMAIDLDEGVLGIQAATIYVVEFQKQSLPHAHILLFVRPKEKPLTAQDVDRLFSAEIPDK